MVLFIAKHNRSILNPNHQVYGCNCRVRNDCTLQHKCLTPGIVYQATVTNSNHGVEKIYYGLCETTFKERYQNRTSSFRHEKNRYETELSNYIWALKKDKIVASIKWKILSIVHGKPTSSYCRLYLTEKFFIINSIGDNQVLNKRSEFVNKGRHQNQYLIKNVKLKGSMD